MIELVNLHKTTIPQYQFLKSLEDDLSVLKYTQLKSHDNNNNNIFSDSSKVGIYSNDEM